MTPLQLIQLLQRDGWYEVKGKASGHRRFRHPFKPGKIVVPFSSKEIAKGTANTILKMAGLK
jgi:predicted RNA binding protein YcfA (HicA-like mRNA interferase family)